MTSSSTIGTWDRLGLDGIGDFLSLRRIDICSSHSNIGKQLTWVFFIALVHGIGISQVH
jgi:hypothetical protein